MTEEKRKNSVKDIINMSVGAASAITFSLVLKYASSELLIPSLLLGSLILLVFFITYTFLYWKKFEKERKSMFSFLCLGMFVLSIEAYIDWKVMAWLEITKIPIFLPFLPAFIYAIWLSYSEKYTHNK
jgi:Na+/citrate or Na+/malate symporter